MSDTSTGNDHHHAPGGYGAISKRLVLTVFFSLLVPIILVVSLVMSATADRKPVPSKADLEIAMAARLQKVGSIQLGEASHELKTGEQVFQVRCSACHGTGAAGSPKFGDAAAWGPRIKSPFESLLNSALKGKGNMSPQGGGDLSDLEIARGVVYMANAGGGKFPEPKVPAAADAAAKK